MHWAQRPGYREYFDLYLEHADRLRQTRIFQVTQEEMADSVMTENLDQHADPGIEVYATDKAQVPQALLRPLVPFNDELLLLHTRRDPSSDWTSDMNSKY